MHVVVLINGREAIPVRAIPLVAPVPYGVRYLVEGLMCCDRSNAMHGLTAYQWSPGAKQPLAVPPTQWMQVDSRLRALKASLERQESTELLSREEGEDRYNRESISILPAGVFVWKDDFVEARTRKLRRVPEHEIVALEDSSRDHLKFLQQQLELPANDPAADQWEYSLGENWREQLAAYIAEECAIDPFQSESIVLYERNRCGQAPLTDVSFSPLVEDFLCKRVMEGFESLLPVEAPDRTSTVHRRESQRTVSGTSAADLPQSVIDAMAVGYKDLEKLCNVDDDFGGYVVKKTGLYVKNHKKKNKHTWRLLAPSERSVLAWHPTGKYDKPALSLPCSFGELCAFLEEAGLNGAIDQFAGNRSHPPLLPAPSCSTNQHLSMEQGRKSRGGVNGYVRGTRMAEGGSAERFGENTDHRRKHRRRLVRGPRYPGQDTGRPERRRCNEGQVYRTRVPIRLRHGCERKEWRTQLHGEVRLGKSDRREVHPACTFA